MDRERIIQQTLAHWRKSKEDLTPLSRQWSSFNVFPLFGLTLKEGEVNRCVTEVKCYNANAYTGEKRLLARAIQQDTEVPINAFGITKRNLDRIACYQIGFKLYRDRISTVEEVLEIFKGIRENTVTLQTFRDEIR